MAGKEKKEIGAKQYWKDYTKNQDYNLILLFPKKT